MDWTETEILVTGGTGSLGKTLAKFLSWKYHPKGIRIYSRGELQQWEMKREMEEKFPAQKIAYLIGDVRDKDRLQRAMERVHFVFHTAALKQVPTCEYNPFEAVKTNIYGAQNVIDCAIDCDVKKVLNVSTDKGVNPINLYGATKLCAEKLFIHGNVYSRQVHMGGFVPKFSCCRYGNVIGSAGSIVPLFKEQAKAGRITITDKNMTRFWITQERVAGFLVDCIRKMEGGEIFIPRMPSVKIIDVANAISVKAKKTITGIRPGEKIHECLITYEEGMRVVVEPDKYIIGQAVLDNDPFTYTSEENTYWLTKKEIKELI